MPTWSVQDAAASARMAGFRVRNLGDEMFEISGTNREGQDFVTWYKDGLPPNYSAGFNSKRFGFTYRICPNGI